jgi:Zn-dependent protease
MSLAGPMANFTLVLIAAVLLNLGSVTQVFQTDEMGGVEKFLTVLFSLNLLLGIFNLIPIPPLDGFTVLAIFLPENAALRLFDFGAQIRTFSFLVLFVGFQYFGTILDPLRALAVHYLLPLYR